jgi:hypothetical protein
MENHGPNLWECTQPSWECLSQCLCVLVETTKMELMYSQAGSSSLWGGCLIGASHAAHESADLLPFIGPLRMRATCVAVKCCSNGLEFFWHPVCCLVKDLQYAVFERKERWGQGSAVVSVLLLEACIMYNMAQQLKFNHLRHFSIMLQVACHQYRALQWAEQSVLHVTSRHVAHVRHASPFSRSGLA